MRANVRAKARAYATAKQEQEREQKQKQEQEREQRREQKREHKSEVWIVTYLRHQPTDKSTDGLTQQDIEVRQRTKICLITMIHFSQEGHTIIKEDMSNDSQNHYQCTSR